MKKLLPKISFDTPIYVEVQGRSVVHAQGYCRIIGYSGSEIELSCDEHRILIRGDGLGLSHLSFGRLAVNGRIDGIDFLQADK